MNSTQIVRMQTISVTSILVSSFTFLALSASAEAAKGFGRLDFKPEIICRAKHDRVGAVSTTSFQGVMTERPQAQLTLRGDANRNIILFGTCEKNQAAAGNYLVCRVQSERASYIVGLFQNKNKKLVSSVVQGDDTLLASDLECLSTPNR